MADGATHEARVSLFKLIDMEVHEGLLKILKSLMRASTTFNRPVDLPEYLRHIKQPMDLGTVKQQLEDDMRKPYAEKRYRMAEELAHDVRLVFKNCFVFNVVPSHQVFKEGLRYLNRFEDMFAKVEGTIEEKGPRVPQRTRCQLLLIDLRRNPMTEWFRREEDWRSLGAQYLADIKSKTPMDLDRVQHNFNSGKYGADDASFDVDAFAADVHLIWQNAIDYNTVNTWPGVVAKVLQSVFAARLDHVKRAPVPRMQAASGGDAAASAAGGDSKRRKLYSLARRLPQESAADLSADIESLYPGRAVRRGEDTKTVDLEQLSESECADLVERATALSKRGT